MPKPDGWPTETEVRAAFGPRLRDVRKSTTALLQKHVAHICGVTEVQQSKYETGREMPGWDYLHRLAHTLGFSITYLLSGDGPKLYKSSKKPPNS